MSGVGAVGSHGVTNVASVPGPMGSGAPAATGGAAALLPDSGAPGPAQINDALAMIYTLLAKQAQTDLASGQKEIDANKTARADAIKKEIDALQKKMQAEAQENDSGGFFSCIGKIFSDIAKDLVTFDVKDLASDFADNCSAAWNSPNFWKDLECGAASVLKVVTTALTVAVATAVAGPLGADYVLENPDSTFAKVCCAAGEAALTCCTAGAGGALVVAASIALSVGGKVVQETHCLGDASDAIGGAMGAAGTVVAIAGGNGGELASTVDGAVNVAEGGSQVIEGAAHMRVANFEGDAQDAKADALAAQKAAARLMRLATDILANVKDLQKSHRSAMETVQGAMQTNDQSLLMAASMRA